MPSYAISFSLTHDGTYSDRYTSLMEAIRKCRKVWAETTSFAIVDTSEDLEALERRRFLSKFEPAKDILLVTNVSQDECIARGKIADPKTLRELMPRIQVK